MARRSKLDIAGTRASRDLAKAAKGQFEQSYPGLEKLFEPSTPYPEEEVPEEEESEGGPNRKYIGASTQSSRVAMYQFLPDTGELYVRFKRAAKTGMTAGKTLYKYENATMETFNEIVRSSSKGGYVNDILNKLPYGQAEEGTNGVDI